MADQAVKQAEALLKKGSEEQLKGVKELVETAMEKKDLATTEKLVTYGTEDD